MIVLSEGDVSIRPCRAGDAESLKIWFPDDGNAENRVDIRVVDEFTIWPFTILQHGQNIGFMQAWRMTNGTAGLEIFIAPEFRRRAAATRALGLMARHLRESLRWNKITIEPHDDDVRGIACCTKAGFVDRGERRDDGDHRHVILEWP